MPALVVTYEIVLSPFVVRSKNKPLKRVTCDSMLRYLSYLPGPELLYLLGNTSTERVYSGWAKKERQPITVDELEDGGKLLWIGPKKNQKVLLYCHGMVMSSFSSVPILMKFVIHVGGGFVVPVLDFMIKFWRYIQLELEKRGLEVGVAMMCYCKHLSFHLRCLPSLALFSSCPGGTLSYSPLASQSRYTPPDLD